MNSDGKADLIAIDDTGLTIYYSQGTDDFDPTKKLFLSGRLNSADNYASMDRNPRIIGDMDGDGKHIIIIIIIIIIIFF